MKIANIENLITRGSTVLMKEISHSMNANIIWIVRQYVKKVRKKLTKGGNFLLLDLGSSIGVGCAGITWSVST